MAWAGIVAGATLSVAVIAASFIVSSSFRQHILENSNRQYGELQLVLRRDSIFDQSLTGAFTGASSQGQGRVSGILNLPGSVKTTAEKSSLPVNVWGIDETFSRLAETAPVAPAAGGVLLQREWAVRHNLSPGDTLTLRVESQSSLSRSLSFQKRDDSLRFITLSVEGLLDNQPLSHIHFRHQLVTPPNIFVALGTLQKLAECPKHINLIGLTESMTPEMGLARLRRRLTPEDLDWRLTALPEGWVEIRPGSIYFTSAEVEKLAGIFSRRVELWTHFANVLVAGQARTPSSMICAYRNLSGQTLPGLPDSVSAGGVAINPWLAEDLQVGASSHLSMNFPMLSAAGLASSRDAEFLIDGILPFEGWSKDATLMPEFPGLHDADSCQDWDSGLAIDFSRIRPKDEAYWRDHRGTPKAFLNLDDAERLWSNPFGRLTAIRLPQTTPESVRARLVDQLKPSASGWSALELRRDMLGSVRQGFDFAGLLMAFGSFIVFSGLILASLMFRMYLERRRHELFVLRASGMAEHRIRQLFTGEIVSLSLLSSVIGIALSPWLAAILLWVLRHPSIALLPQDPMDIEFDIATLLVIGGSYSLIPVILFHLHLKNIFAQNSLALLHAAPSTHRTSPAASFLSKTVPFIWMAFFILLALGISGTMDTPLVFFAAGFCWLCAALGCCANMFYRSARQKPATDLNPRRWLMLQSCRRPERSMACVTLFALGIYLTVAASAHQRRTGQDSLLPGGGTGGYEFMATSHLPIHTDLSESAGWQAYGLDPEIMKGVDLVCLRYHEGDDASCMNPLYASSPLVLGVPARRWHREGRFRFSRILKSSKHSGWDNLTSRKQPDLLPAVLDENTLMWSLQKKLGESFDIEPDNRHPLKLLPMATLADSIFQSAVLIDEDDFIRAFPHDAGYRVILLKSPAGQTRPTIQHLEERLANEGLIFQPTVEILDAYHGVQNSYLQVFQFLSAMGLFFGCLGMAAVVHRNIWDRRRELAMLHALGQSKSQLVLQLIQEHLALLHLALLIGFSAAAWAIFPTRSPASPPLPISMMLGATLAGYAVAAITLLLTTRFGLSFGQTRPLAKDF